VRDGGSAWLLDWIDALCETPIEGSGEFRFEGAYPALLSLGAFAVADLTSSC
jgi:hypothetical protein